MHNVCVCMCGIWTQFNQIELNRIGNELEWSENRSHRTVPLYVAHAPAIASFIIVCPMAVTIINQPYKIEYYHKSVVRASVRMYLHFRCPNINTLHTNWSQRFNLIKLYIYILYDAKCIVIWANSFRVSVWNLNWIWLQMVFRLNKFPVNIIIVGVCFILRSLFNL